jgi:hypothetical protein
MQLKHFSKSLARNLALSSCLIFTAGCTAVTPFGASLAGTDAERIVVTGNSRTGDYRMEATGFNQSRSVDRAAESLENLTRLRVYQSVTENAVNQSAKVADGSLDLAAEATQ